jgi:hypothetical protein
MDAATLSTATRYRTLRLDGARALWSYRTAREQVRQREALAFRRWCAEFGFALSMIGVAAMSAEAA